MKDAWALLAALRRRLFTLLALLPLLAASGGASAQAAPGFGVMVHFLPGDIQEVTSFDVDAFADSLAQMRASYVIFTLGQNNGLYVAPNPVLEALCPQTVLNRSPRDLPMDIATALKARGISMVLYLPFRAPQDDAGLLGCLSDVSEQLPPPPQFIVNWSSVIKYWSDRYGDLATGWWFDGTYNTTGMSANDWTLLCNAALSSGPQRMVAFNNGEGADRFYVQSAPCQNWMAGEYNDPPVPLVAPQLTPPSPLQFHIATPLGSDFGVPSDPRFSAAQVQGWIVDALALGGSFTLDMGLDATLHLVPSQIAVAQAATGGTDTTTPPITPADPPPPRHRRWRHY